MKKKRSVQTRTRYWDEGSVEIEAEESEIISCAKRERNLASFINLNPWAKQKFSLTVPLRELPTSQPYTVHLKRYCGWSVDYSTGF